MDWRKTKGKHISLVYHESGMGGVSACAVFAQGALKTAVVTTVAHGKLG